MKKFSNKLVRRHKPEVSQPGTESKVTNNTVAEHREEVLGQARKYIYPLRQTKHKLVKIAAGLLLIAVIAFFTYCILALYKFKSNSQFLYKVTQVIPFPAARSGSTFVSYEDYLFEVNHYTHYYQTQQNLDFKSEQGKQQLNEFKKRALDKVIDDAYIKELANRKGVSVSDKEIDERITVVRNQNRLGASDKEFQSVLKDFWNWTENDFRRSLKSQILSEKVVAAYDTDTKQRAEKALSELKSGKDFATLASEVSEDPSSKASKGDYGFPIEKTNRDISPAAIEALFNLKDGQYSEIVDVGYGLEIVKNVQTQPDGKIRGAHIAFNYKDIKDYTNDLKEEKPTRAYLRF